MAARCPEADRKGVGLRGDVMKRAPTAARLLALFGAGALAFGFPLIELWLAQPLSLFLIWVLLIVALAWVMEAGDD